MKINLNEIRRVFNDMLDKANELGFKENEAGTNYYWAITSEDKTNFEIGSPNICVGSLVDDYTELKKVTNDINPPTVVDFDRIANIIIQIGNAISNSETPYLFEQK